MACSLTQGNTVKTCASSAGTKRVLVANFENVTAITSSAGVVSGITMATGKQFFAYAQESEVANWKSEWAKDQKTGNGAYTETGVIEVQGLTGAQVVELDLLNRAKTIQIYHDTDGTYWLLGAYDGLTTGTNSTESGVAMGDFKGSKITFTGRNPQPVLQVQSSIIADLLEPA